VLKNIAFHTRTNENVRQLVLHIAAATNSGITGEAVSDALARFASDASEATEKTAKA
jgi:hypothetical protein